LEIARRALPNDPRLFELTGYILRRRGQQEEGLQNLQRAVELDPRNFLLCNRSRSVTIPGRYAEAIAALDRALAIVPDNVETRANRGLCYICWKADTRPLARRLMQSSRKDRAPLPAPRTAGSFALWPNAIRLRPNEHSSRWATIHAGRSPIILSHSFGEGLLARMTKDEARARTAFEAARAQQEKIVQAQPDYGPALCVLGLIDAALGRKDLALEKAVGRSRSRRWKKMPSTAAAFFNISPSRQPGRREGACLAATGSWTACSRRSVHAELRCLETIAILGSAPRRSALRANRRLVGAEMIMAADYNIARGIIEKIGVGKIVRRDKDQNQAD
jgi:hypothetical protein